MKCSGCQNRSAFGVDMTVINAPGWSLLTLCWECATGNGDDPYWINVYAEVRGLKMDQIDTVNGGRFRPGRNVFAGHPGMDFRRLKLGVLCMDSSGPTQTELYCSSGLALRKMGSRWWNVVHVRSGKAVIAGAQSRWVAERGAKKLGALCDWRESEVKLFNIFASSRAATLALALINLRSVDARLSKIGSSLAHKCRTRRKKKPVQIVKGMTRAEWENSRLRVKFKEVDQ